MVVPHIVALQALIVLTGEGGNEGGGGEETERGEECVCESVRSGQVLTMVGTVKSCTDSEVIDTKRSWSSSIKSVWRCR